MNRYSALKDNSFWTLLCANVFSISLALWEHWDLSTLLWVYWFQSVIIGVFNFFRILMLDEFSTEGFTENGRPVPETNEGKVGTAFFFLIHYGFFHLGYFLFLKDSISIDGRAVFLGASIFFLNHLFSFLYNRPRGSKKQNIGRVMFYPYLRIIPMHFVILFGMTFGSAALFFFLVLKTLADLGMHRVEHALRQGEVGYNEELEKVSGGGV